MLSDDQPHALVPSAAAGRFFKHLPEYTHVIGPEYERSARWCLEELVHLDK